MENQYDLEDLHACLAADHIAALAAQVREQARREALQTGDWGFYERLCALHRAHGWMPAEQDDGQKTDRSDPTARV